jgi:negative regulator of sigma E activity
LWQRIEAEPTRSGRAASEPADKPSVPAPRVRVVRPWRWAVPALAAAAIIALAFSSQLRPRTPEPATPASAPPERVAVPAPEARKPEPPAVAAARPAPKADAPQVAAADELRPEDLRPEDLPPELAEHPELFLRLPVVRRLDTLEHFDAVHDSHGADEDGAG